MMLGHCCAEAQNLVPNSSFEQIKKQPCNIAKIEGLQTYFHSWVTPTIASTDAWLYNPVLDGCIENTAIYGVMPNSGSYCIGLLAATIPPESLSILSKLQEYREYAQVRLSQPLTIGRNYYAEMYVLPLNISEVFNNNLGICFTTNALQQYVREDKNPFTSKLPGTPQINEKRVLNIPNKWVKVAGCFKATEAYSYLTIGNFFSNENTLFTINPTFTKRTALSRIANYYLVDDVLVRESTVKELPRAFGRNIDTTLCNGASLTIRPVPSDSTQLSWENGSTNPVRTIQQPGTYFITASRGECSVTDTLRVRREVNPVLPPDTLLCRGEALRLSASVAQKKYEWSTGSTDSTITVTEPGTYRLRVPSANCQLSDAITVSFADCPGLVPNTITPNGDGKNDTFRIDNTDLTAWKIDIYNRWGKLIYTAYPYHNEWDGGNLPGGVYYYELSSVALKRSLKGYINLIRDAR